MAKKSREERIAEQDAMREEIERRRAVSDAAADGRRREAGAYAARVIGQETLLLVVQLGILAAAGAVGAAVAGGLGLLVGLVVGAVAVGALRVVMGAIGVRAGFRARRR
jgi:hypothetical protein